MLYKSTEKNESYFEMSDMKTTGAATARAARKVNDVSDDEAQSLKLNKLIGDYNKNVLILEKVQKDGKEFAETCLNDFEEKVKLKKRKIEDMEEDFKLQHKNKLLELSNSIKEAGYDKAVEILASRNPKEISVPETVYAALTAKITQLEREMKQSIAQEVGAHKSNLDREFKYNEETGKLRQATESAKIQAQLEQRDKHIVVLQDSLQTLKQEVNEQRKLTQSISESFSNAQKPTMVTNADGNYGTGSRR